MSQGNVEIMRRAIDRFNRGGEDDALLEETYDLQAVFYSREDEPDTGVYRGREAIRGLMGMWREMFEGFSFEVDEYIEVGDTLVMPGWVSVHARGSDMAIREPYSWVAKLRDGKVLEVHEYRTRKEALKAAGVAE
jgi:ketosteroid isomerase-like protein